MLELYKLLRVMICVFEIWKYVSSMAFDGNMFKNRKKWLRISIVSMKIDFSCFDGIQITNRVVMKRFE